MRLIDPLNFVPVVFIERGPFRGCPSANREANTEIIMLKSLIVAAPIAALALIGFAGQAQAQAGAPAPAPAEAAPQTDISEAELTQFANALQEVQAIRQAAEMEMVAAIEAQGLTVDQFNAIAQARQNPEAQAEISLSEEEAASFGSAIEEVNELSQSAQADMVVAVESEGLSVAAYNQIASIVRDDPSLQNELRQILGQ